MGNFKVGDRVRCTNSAEGQFTKGKDYIVSSVYGDRIGVVQDDSGSKTNGWEAKFFKLVEEPWDYDPRTAKSDNRLRVGDTVSCSSNTATTYRIKAAYGDKVDVASLSKSGSEGFTYKSQPARLFTPVSAEPASPAIVAVFQGGKPRPSGNPFVHPSADAATIEAERLARQNPGQEFGVFTLVTKLVADVTVRAA